MVADKTYLDDVAKRAICHQATKEAANKHRIASGVHPLPKTPLSPDELCECCLMPADNISQYPLSVEIDQLQELGSAFPLLFYYTKFLAGLLALVLLCSSLPELAYYLHLYSKYAGDSKASIAATTLGGGVEALDDFEYWPAILNLVTVIVLAPAITLGTYYIRKKADKLKMNTPSLAARSILVHNLDPKWDENDILTQLKARHLSDQAEVIFSYKLTERGNNGKELIKLLSAWSRGEHTSVRQDSEVNENSGMHQTSSPREAIKRPKVEELLNKRKGFKNDSNKTGTAIIMFREVSDQKAALDTLKLNPLLEVVYQLTSTHYPYHCDGRNISVQSASEPSDINWENFEYGRKSCFIREALGLVGLLVLLGASLGMLFGLADWQNYNVQEGKKGKNYYKSVPPAVLIVIGNILLLVFIQTIAYYERHYTYTKVAVSVASKLTIVLSINTLLLPYLVCEGSDEGYSAGLLGSKIFWVAVVAWVNTFIRVCHPLRVYRLVQKCRLQKKFARKEVETQAIANKLYQQEEFDIADCYSDQMIRFLLALTYAPIVPLVIPVTLLGYLVDYWVNKWLLLRMSCRPKCLDKEILERMLLFLNPALVLFAVVSLTALRSLKTDTQDLGIAAVCISGVSVCVNLCCQHFSLQTNSSVTPPSTDRPFVTFKITNPITRSEDQNPDMRLTSTDGVEDLKPAFMFKSMCNPRVREVIKKVVEQVIREAPEIVIGEKDRLPMD